jgi:tRNA pseudouridine32 synthase/23S rRNA pseudouridine746 synthase
MMTESLSHFERHISIDSNACSAIEKLSYGTGLSKMRVKQAMQKGAVWLSRGKQTKRLRRAKKSLRVGDMLHLYYDEKILAAEPSQPEMIADREAYSVWYKPYGLRSQGSKWGDHCTVHRWVEQHLRPQRPAFVVHRLDRAATGLILIAHQKRVATALAKLFETREIEKRYRAVVRGRFPLTPEPLLMKSDIDCRQALSYATYLGYDAERDRSLVEVVIETGRKHQIRRHLSELGFPVVGDRLYGEGDNAEDLKLTAYSLAFCCPVIQKNIQFQLPEKWIPNLT